MRIDWHPLALFWLLLLLSVRVGYSQVNIRLEPDHLLGSDTLWVDVRLSQDIDSLQVPIWAFQFRVLTDFGIRFLGSDSAYSLSGIQGWLTDYNAENGLVGGFSSRSDAINRAGVLIRLQFFVSSTDTPVNIMLQELRLNSGNPDHYPAVPSLRLDFSEHLE